MLALEQSLASAACKIMNSITLCSCTTLNLHCSICDWCLQIDEQDAEERAELRRKQIESANKMLYDDTDRPKALHSKMLLSDVMQERVVQMDYAHQIKALKRQQDDAFLVQQTARLKVRDSGCCHHTAHYVSCYAHVQMWVH